MNELMKDGADLIADAVVSKDVKRLRSRKIGNQLSFRAKYLAEVSQ